MKKLTIALTASALCWVADTAPAHACGFKAGGAIGAVRFDQLNHTANPVNILMYSNPKSEEAKNTLSPTLEKVLSKVGHAVHRTESKEDFLKIAKDGRFPCEEHGWHNVQVVLADMADADLVSSESELVVPIVSKPNEFDQAQRKKYPNVLTPSKRPSSHLPAIETAARIAHTKKGGAPILLASDVRSKAAGEGGDRTLVSTQDQRLATNAKNDRTPVAAGPDDPASRDRGGALKSGAGEGESGPAATEAKTDNVSARKELVATNEPKKPIDSKAEAAPVDAKTENASRTMDDPSVEKAAKPETKAEKAAREKAEKAERAAAEKQAKQDAAEKAKAEKAEKFASEKQAKVDAQERAKQDKQEAVERARQDKEEKAERIKSERAEKASRAKESRASSRSDRSDREDRVAVTSIKNEVYFTPATYRLHSAAAAKLASHLKWMKDNPSANVTLEGHADRSGRPDLNMKLSAMRAEAVKKYFISKGIPESRLQTAAMGDEHPVDPPGDSSRNRCVVVVTPGAGAE